MTLEQAPPAPVAPADARRDPVALVFPGQGSQSPGMGRLLWEHSQAARDTSSLIEESIAKSNEGKLKVDLVATAIKSITQEAVQVKTLVDEVNLGSDEQARGIEQIGKAILQMEQVTQRTAASAEEGASAAEELNAQSETLKGIVQELAAMVGGAESAADRPVKRQAPEPSRPRESAQSLTALRKAVSSQSKVAFPPQPVAAGHGTSKDAFPLDEDFKEF